MNTNRRKDKGFTVLELTVAVAILSLLLSITFPHLERMRQNADDARTAKELQSIYTAIIMFETANGRKPTSWPEMWNYIWIPDVESKYELNPTP